MIGISSNSKVITKEQMNGWNIPACIHDVQSIKLRIFIFNSVFSQGLLHIKRPSQTFPDVASSVLVKFEISVQYLFNGLLRRDLKDCAMIVDHIDYSYPSSFLSQLANNVLGIFPPLYFTFGLNMQIFPSRTVKLSFSSFQIDLHSRLSAVRIKPVSNISPRSFNKGRGQNISDIFLDNFCKIVDLTKQNYPAIVPSIMKRHLLESIVSLFVRFNRKELLQTVFRMSTHQVIQLLSSIQKYNRRMKFSPASKIVPNSFYRHSQDIQQFNEKVVTPLKPADHQRIVKSAKNNRKNMLPKIFIEDVEDEISIQQENVQHIDEIVQDKQHNEQEQTRTSHNLTTTVVNCKKANVLHQLQIKQDSQPDQQKYQQILQPSLIEDTVSLPVIKNFDKLKLMEWSKNNSENEQRQAQSKKSTLNKNIINPPIIFNKQALFGKLEKEVECILRRDKKNASGFLQYNIFLKENSQHIVTVRKQGLWNYCIYLKEKMKEGQFFKYTKIGTLQSSFLANKYTLIKQKQKCSSVTIYYQTNILGLSGPRKISVYLPKSNLPSEDLHELYDGLKYRGQIEKYVSRTALWDEKAKSYVLDFNGKAKESSIKNFVITDKQENKKNNFIIFAKAGVDAYNLDIKKPFSLIQGIAVALTAFQRKITCD